MKWFALSRNFEKAK